MGCARKLVFSWGGNPGVGLAAPAARRRRARLAGAARARGALARGHGGGVRGGRVEPAVRRPARLRRHGARGADRGGDDRVPVHRRGAHGRAGAAARRRHRPRAAGGRGGNVQLWGIIGVQKEVVLASARSIVTVEEVVDELEPGPGAIVLPSWVIDAVASRPGRSAPVLRARLLRARQRLLRRVGRDQPRARHVPRVDGASTCSAPRTSSSTGRLIGSHDRVTPTPPTR